MKASDVLRLLHRLCGELPTCSLGNGAFALQWLDGRTFVNYTDETGLNRGATLEQYEQRQAGLRAVRFVAADGSCLREITMDRFLELIGEKR